MITKQPQVAVKSDGSTIPYEIGLGFKLGIGTYYVDVSFPDTAVSSVHCTWDSALVATSLNYQESNLPAFKSLTQPMADKDSAVDVSLYDGTAGNWITLDPSTAYVPAGTGITVTNMTVAIAGGTANGTIFDLSGACGRRGRMKIVTTTGGYFRCHPHGKTV